MTEDSPRANTVRYWRDESKHCLESARRELDAGAFNYAVNRMYYAIFYITTALLFERGMEFRKHSGVRSAFHAEFIAKGIIDKKFGRFYDRLFEDRHEGDYVVFIKFDREYVESLFIQCAEFHEAMRAFPPML